MVTSAAAQTSGVRIAPRQQLEKVNVQQASISRAILNAARRGKQIDTDFGKSFKPISPAQRLLSQRIDEEVRLQQKIIAEQIKNSRRARDLVKELQANSNKVLKDIVEQEKQAVADARRKAEQEIEAQKAQQDREIRQKHDKYFRDVVKNLPQKGRHKNYTASHQRLQPIVSRADKRKDYSSFMQGFRPIARK